MPRLYPPEPDFGDHQSAERDVWDRLRKALPDEVVLLHSVPVRHGSAEHEIDLLVAWPGVGLAAIEVKGGQVSLTGGQWYQSDRKGKHPIQNPMAQVQGAAHALKQWLDQHSGTRLSSRFAHIVCFPYTHIPNDWVTAGIPRELVLDADDLIAPASAIRQAIEAQGGAFTGLNPDFMERLITRITGTLDATSDQKLNSRELEAVQDHLTVRQATLLSSTRSLQRVRFLGGAGSGKTWLAVAKAKELCAQGQRVGLFCYNKGLGQYLSRQVEQWRQNKPVHTGEFHAYATSLGVADGLGQDYFDQRMPQLLIEQAATLPLDQKLDAVIVDEAQDFAPLWWEAMLACMKDPASGQIYAFMDSRQDVYRRWDGEPLGGSFGQSLDLVPIHVDENLRNTRKIAATFRSMLGEHFAPRGGDGLPVRVVQCDTADAIDVASDCVDALITEGWANNQIALLTTKSRHPIHQDHYDARTIDSDYWQGFHADQEEFYGHVLGFKGLERSVVILCVNGFKDMARAAETLYVGLSRARSLLVVVGDQQLITQACGTELHGALHGATTWAPDLAAAPPGLGHGALKFSQ
ncbi:NERD domain-containing protein [Glutamicibacter uratoxydans]|uniref:NERD domain-containing protein n=1 Tax=Glutamicibacter uratoxydans TaxID=43667 RepID=UPI003D6DFD85